MGMNILASFNDTTITKIENFGNVPAKPIITVTFVTSASEFKIEEESTGDYIRVVYSFIAGDVLVINHQNGSIYINDTEAMENLDLSSFFFTIPLDTSRYIITPGLGTTSIKIDFQQKFL